MNNSLTDGLMSDFLDESTEIMRRLNEGLLQLDQAVKQGETAARADEELLNDIFRAAHSLKGLSGMMGLQDVNALTHKVENVFDAVRIGRLGVSGDVVDVSFQAIDRLDAMIELLKSGEQGDVEYQTVLGRIEEVLSGCTVGSTPSVAIEPAKSATSSALPSERDESDSATDPLANIQDDPDVPAKYLGIFIDESDLTLDGLSDVLLQTLDAAGVEALLVGCHRLKGSAASIGLRRVARLAHLMEDQLQELRRREALPDAETVDALLKSTDAIRAYVNGLRKGVVGDDGLSAACRLMVQVGQTTNVETPAASGAASAGKECHLSKLAAAKAVAPRNTRGFVGLVEFESGLALSELKARLVLEKLHRCGTLFYSAPAEDELESVHDLSHLAFGLATEHDAERILAELRISGIATLDLTELNADAPATAFVTPTPPSDESEAEPISVDAPTATSATSVKAAADSKTKPAETLRVDIERLDQLMNLAGQLVITKARFSQIGLKLKRLLSDKLLAQSLAEAAKETERLVTDLRDCKSDRSTPCDSFYAKARQIRENLTVAQRDLGRFTEVRSLLNDLSEAVHQLDRVSDGIQSSVMDTRMVPIGPLFSRFKRVVRDLSRTGGKEINLEIGGEHTELDKRMIDELGDPLIHLIRNSADHGIETPENRLAAGKSRHGTVSLNAFHRGNRIVIQVSDDGRGLDAARIRAKAVAKGWMNETEAEKLTDVQTYALIWRPGFSTAEKVTEVSGRGMGMDIVWSKIEQLNGTVELSSTPGRGTTFEIKLPLTMAILPSLLMEIDGEAFAVPVESVIEIVRIAAGDVTTVYGRPTTRVRGRVISLVRLSELFDDGEMPSAAASPQLTAVIIGNEGREIGLVVDELLGEQDVVIKSLTENFQNVEGIAGASILGDGRVSLILDTAALLQLACRSERSAESPAAPTA